MSYLRVNIFSLCICAGILLSGCESNKVQKQVANNDNVSAVKDETPVEFQITEEEMTAAAKWKSKSLADLSIDAFKGDKGGLYTLGNSFLMGWWGAIDTKLANRFFSMSASFGFAPALDQLRLVYSCDENNSFLSMVYLNLLISEGHTEFAQLYHDIRSAFSRSSESGQKIVQEIERLAIRKRVLIQKNSISFEKCLDVDKRRFVTFLLKNITEEDLVFDRAYWDKVASGNTPSDGEILRLTLDRNLQASMNDKKQLEAYSQK